MPRTKEQFEAMRNATKEKIHTSALKLFTKRGYAATTVQDIAMDAGISTGLMYRHYKSKEELFTDLVSEAAYGIKQLNVRLSSDTDPLTLIQEFSSEVLNDLSTSYEFARLTVLMSMAIMMEGTFPQIHELWNENQLMFKQMTKLIEKGQKSGSFKSGNPNELTLFYFAAIQGLAELKLALEDNFIAPQSNILNAFLLQEGSHD